MAEKQQLIKIVRELKSGNKDMAAVLYEVYYRDLHYYILKRVNDPEKAEALTKDTFIEIYETVGSLKDAKHFVEWSRQLADRRCEEYRHARRALLSGKVGSAVLDSVEKERKELHLEETENDELYLIETKRQVGIKTGAKMVESIARKVIVGVVAALILTMIKESGIDWLHVGGVFESAEEESTTQSENIENTEEESFVDDTEHIEMTAVQTEVESENDESSSVVEMESESATTEAEIQPTEPEENESPSTTPEETEEEPTPPEHTETEATTPETTKPEPTTQVVVIPKPEETEPEETVLLNLYNGYWEVVGFVATQGTDMVVPATYEGLPVKIIGANAMLFHNMLTSVQLPEGIEAIEMAAFQGCGQLRRIDLPETIHVICSYAFSGCVRLEDVVLPSQLWQIPTGMLEGCASLTQINIPEKVKSIADEAFGGCTGLTEIRIPASVTSIAANAFRDCDNLVKIEVDENNPVYYSEGNCLLTKAGNKLILCGNESVIPSDGRITSIGEFALANCRAWMELVIPNGVQEIGAHACDNLRIWKVTIPASVTSIETLAFAMTNLSTIVYGGTIEQWNSIEKAQDWATGCTYKVQCTDGLINEWGVVVN